MCNYFVDVDKSVKVYRILYNIHSNNGIRLDKDTVALYKSAVNLITIINKQIENHDR